MLSTVIAVSVNNTERLLGNL